MDIKNLKDLDLIQITNKRRNPDSTYIKDFSQAIIKYDKRDRSFIVLYDTGIKDSLSNLILDYIKGKVIIKLI
jgi:hypothetical protein